MLWVCPRGTYVLIVRLGFTGSFGSRSKQYFLSTCKISRLIDLGYGTEYKISLPMLRNCKALVKFLYHHESCWIFSSIFAKFRENLKNFEKQKKIELGNFRVSVICQFSCRFFSNFLSQIKTVQQMVEKCRCLILSLLSRVQSPVWPDDSIKSISIFQKVAQK